MKRKDGQNIITDCDVTVTGPSNLGNSLNTVIEEFSEDIHDLKSQLKWTHKYGAVGSGVGGGGGSTKWSIVATLDGQTIENGKVISLSKGVNTYNLRIAISGGSESYHVTYSYGNVSYTIDLSSANNWKTNLSIPLNTNGIVSIEATDNLLIKTVYSSYIVVPYEFTEIQLCRDSEVHDLIPYESNNIFINQAAEESLYAKFDYDITVNATCTYTWKFLDIVETGEILDKKGYKAFNIGNVLEITEANANAYNIELTIEVQPENQSSHTIRKTTTFNLIPNNLYLQLTPQTGLIYNEIQQDLDSIYQYSINRDIGFTAKVYNGLNTSRDVNIYCWVDDDPMPEEHRSVKERETCLFVVSYPTEGWHTIHFLVQMDATSILVTKYLYCVQVASDFNWFRNATPSLQFGYKGYAPEHMIGTINPSIDSSYLRFYRANNETTSYFLTNPPTLGDNLSNILINLSVQYNEINNTDAPICTIVSTDNNDFIKIYQNKISFSGITGDVVDCNFFLPKEKNYAPGDVDKYHLITISIAAVYQNASNNETYYEYNVYLDGILEGALNTWPTSFKITSSFNFNPGNYSVNHFTVDYFGGSAGTSILKDSDINYYYYSYKVESRNSTSAVSDQERNILNFLYDPTTNQTNYTMEHDLIKLNSSTFYDDVAINTSVPTLVFQVNETQETIQGRPSIFTWLNKSYKQDDTDILANVKISTRVKWGVGTRTEFINIQEDNHEFYIKLQGSSTMNNKSKNLTLGVQKTSQDSGPVVLFSPNFKKEDYSTFLPETSFTLKADVVDSSHTNNVAIGKFVNENNNFDYDINQSGVDIDILSHVRKCLDGFPVLVYLETIGSDGQTVTGDYFLGVYSFNLGRDSYFNLGYSDLSQLDPRYIPDCTSTTFSFTTVGAGNSRGLDPLEGFVSAEVQDNSMYWDFSQYDSTVLFKQGTETADFMFGDIATYSANTSANSSIQEFVRRVSRAGGYLFKEMGKTFVDVKNELSPDSIEYAYHTPDVVPNYRTQYTRTGKNYTIKETINEAQYNDLVACVGGEQDGEVVPGYVNFNSVSNYYTTCMTFGLVDSVQKNLTIKTWDGNKFGAFFYDMDTCLGRDNNGNPTSYFCFSDYWRSDIKEYDENGDLIDRALNPNAVAVQTINDGVTVDRDYFPLTHKMSGYDIPSSYLFALAKYLKTLPDYRNDLSYDSPQTIYGRWRQVGGPLETAETFINTYYASNLANIPECLLNLNYRNKYLYYSNDEGNKTSFDNISKFLFGRGIGATTEWLDGRLHILDAYFNLQGSNIIINNQYTEPIPDVASLSTNLDIIILRDAFAEGNQPWNRKSGNVEFVVNAPDYTPLIVRGASSLQRYLLEDSSIDYTVRTSFSGNQVTIFGGSQLWTSLDSINPFVESSVPTNVPWYMNNKYVEDVSGTSGTYTSGFNLQLPAVRELTLTSSGYAGALTIDQSFENLSSIDISNSSISLNVNGAGVKTIDASNINSSSLYITNCSNLTNVNLLNANVQDCRINPAWTNNIDLSDNKIRTLTISGKAVNNQYGTLTISNNSNINSVVFDNFENIAISNCSNLTSLISNDSVHSRIKTLSVTGCNDLTSVTIYADGLTSLDLHGCVNLNSVTLLIDGESPSLNSLNLRNTKVTTIKFENGAENSDVMDLTRFKLLGKASGNTINFQNVTGLRIIKFDNNENSPVRLTTSFDGCSDLERVYGNVEIRCQACFDDLKKFSVHGSDLTNLTWKGSYVLNGNRVKHPLEISSNMFCDGDNVTNMKLVTATMTYGFRNTNCTIFDYYYILYNIGPSVRTLTQLFAYAQNSTWGIFDYRNEKNIDKRIFTNCGAVTNVSFLFGYKTHRVYLTSPTTQEVYDSETGITDRVPTADDGLFSPLTSVTNLSSVFYNGVYYCDKSVFRRLSGNYAITNLTRFKPEACFNYPVNPTSADITAALEDRQNNTGDLYNFFNNLPSLTTIHGSFNGINYINYNRVFKIPTGCKNILNAFVSDYASCTEFIPGDFFATPGTVTAIAQSFRQLNASENYKVIMPMRNNTFSQFTALTTLGHSTTSLNQEFYGDYDNTSFKGFYKQINPSGFPFNILSNCTRLTRVTGLFENATCSATLSNLKLPGTLFSNNPLLTETSKMFFDIKVPYQLSDTGNFSNCPNITVVDYMFAQSPTNALTPVLSGPIPKGFFKHGGTYVTLTTLPGTNERTETEVDGEIEYTYGTLHESETFELFNPNATITSIKHCFEHSNLDPYFNDDPEVEINPNYNAYQYVLKNGNMVEATVYPKYTFMWEYDGGNKPSEYSSDPTNYEMLDVLQENDYTTCVALPISDSARGVAEESHYFIAPPDLLRYCTENCNIDGLFANCGLWGWDSANNDTDNYYNMLGYGLKGRICPYMLKPVPNITSVQDLFRCCKKLSYYYRFENGSERHAYMIPETFFTYAPKVTNLSNMFRDTLQPSGSDLLNTFKPLKGTLNITEIFYRSYWDGTNSLAQVFKTNNISATARAFAIRLNTETTSYRKITQNIGFSDMFNNKYSKSAYSTNSNFYQTFCGYSSSTVTFGTKTLNQDERTHNYFTW